MDTDFICNVPIPVCVVGADGNVLKANSLMKKVIVYEDIVGANFFMLTGIKRDALVTANSELLLLDRNDRTFRIRVNENADPDEEIIVYFDDRTARENYKKDLENERPTVLFINIDNFDELIASVPEEYKRVIPSQIDNIVRKWAATYKSPLMSTGDDTYVMFSTFEKTKRMIESNFSVLDEVRNIEAEVDFPISISIGAGMSESSLNESTELAESALALALGRGGDQAVVKGDEHTDYYGGTSQTVEKNNRGKARVIAHAVRRLVKEADKVLIMGHHWPDMDSFGSAIGAYSICRFLDRDAYIVIEEHSDVLDAVFDQAFDSEEYNIIKHEKAMQIAENYQNCLLIIVDTNRPMLTEYPELLEKCSNIILIDHHRRTEDSLRNTAVSYVESYASSASELVSEIIQHISQKRFITRFEGEAMLAGIMVDTNNFSGRTGVRTFEAAAWLKRAGADPTEVKRFFQEEKSDVHAKATALANGEFTEDGIAYAKTECESLNSTIINAQVADELLMIKGVKASFVIGRNEKGMTIISARSLGDINVQFIMEKFGGGGHFTSAAAQVTGTYEEVREQLETVLNEYLHRESGEEK